MQIDISFPDKLKGYHCTCCGSFIKMYKRSFNSNMALCISVLVKHNIQGFVKVEDFMLEHGHKRCGDFSYLVHYRMLEKMSGDRIDGSSRNGYYRVTSMGILFAERKISVQEKFLIENNHLMGFEGKEIFIDQVPKFNYNELMNGA